MSNLLSSIFSLEALWYVLVAIYGLICIALIGVIMLQKGKGAGFAGAFGLGPGSETIFGPRGSKSLPVRLTRIGAGLFIFLAFVLSALSGHVGQGSAPEEIITDATAGVGELEGLGLGDQSGETAPAAETPAVTEPAVETPAAPADGGAAPVVEAPAIETPAPVVEAPATETPAPVVEAPVTEAPAPAEAPVTDTAAPAEAPAEGSAN